MSITTTSTTIMTHLHQSQSLSLSSCITINQTPFQKKNKKVFFFFFKTKKKLTPAPCNGTAATAVRVGLSTRLAVVIRGPTFRARHSVPLQRTIADVAAGG